MANIDQDGFAPVAANHVPLSPLSFLERARVVWRDHTSVIYGERRYTWSETAARSARLASALAGMGVGKGDVVSVLALNTPEMVEAHFGVPMAGAVLNAINARLDADTIAYILGHAETKVLITDSGFSPTVKAALAQMGDAAPRVIDIVDPAAPGEPLGEMDYEALLTTGDASTPIVLPADEWETICLNYTSGTSGRPKGVLYQHRGAYLMALGTIAGWGLPPTPTYLYIVPLFHCNGWCHGWGMAAIGGTIVCIRTPAAPAIFDAIATHGVTHFGAAPVVLTMLVNAPAEDRRAFDHKVNVMTAGAPPPPAILQKMGAMGFEVMQSYGLTETFGHVTQCVWHEKWDSQSADEQAAIKARQGVGLPITEEVRVVDVATRQPVPWDGETPGEVLLRGNTVMKGYFKNPEATADVFADGAFKSGDIAVVHPDGYIEIRDRLKDVIISGGENISSVEVEGVLYKHPAVAFAAVVAQKDDKWGEVPCACVELKEGAVADEAEIIAFARSHLAGFKSPKRVIFGPLPKTATGKIRKFELRSKL